MKFVPVRVMVNWLPPKLRVLGEMVFKVGDGLLTVNVLLAEVPPPGAEFVTVTVCVPAETISEARTVMLSCVSLM